MAAAWDLCTLTDVRTALQKATGQTGSDTELSALITDASDILQREIDTWVQPAETSAPKTFSWDGCLTISLTPHVARTVTAVTLDPGEPSSTALTSGDWRLAPIPAYDSVYRRLELSALIIPAYTGNFSGPRRATVTGTWGFSTVPDSLQRAAILTVVAWYRTKVAAYSTQYEDGIEQRDDQSIPTAAYRLLNQWRRWEA